MIRIAPRIALSLATLALAAGCGGSSAPAAGASSPVANAAVDAKLREALANPQRTEAERARDRYRHPRETLELFGLRDDMHVVELSPGGGWYTAILAPLLRDHGKLVVAGGDPNGDPNSEGTKAARALAERFAKAPDAFGKVQTMVLDANAPSLGPAGSADLVLTFRNAHGWISRGTMDKVLAAAFQVLKPGGVLGVVEHRANAGASTDPKAIGETGYVPEALVVQLAEKAGFKLDAKSEVNANPKDTKDHPKGVWTLPPTYRLGDQDRAKYEAIGESDRMTLKFVKP